MKEAVKEYLASEAFQFEMAENNADGFDRGFHKCQAQVEALHLGIDLGRLVSDESSDEEDGGASGSEAD